MCELCNYTVYGLGFKLAATICSSGLYMEVSQNQGYHFGGPLNKITID